MSKDLSVDPKPLLLGADDSGLVPDGLTLVLGITWKVIFGDKLGAMALERALASKANLYVHAKNVGTVGYCKLALKKKTKYISAAGALASQRQMGDFLIALEVNEDQTWLCGVSNGSVVSGYDLVADDSSQIANIVDVFRERFPAARLQGDIGGLFVNDYDWQLMSAVIADTANLDDVTLRTTSQGLTERVKKLPRSYLVVGGLLLVMLTGQRFVWPVINTAFFQPKPAPIIDPQLVWQEAVDEWTAAHQVSRDGSLNDLLAILSAQDLTYAGWQQTGVVCVWGQKAWQCTAKFVSTSRKQTNLAFSNAIPKTWQADFTLLKDATARFAVPTSAKSMSAKTLKSGADLELSIGSSIQEIGPLLTSTSAPLTPFTQVKLVEPKTEKGAAIPLPAGIGLPKVSSLSIAGPLRNIAAIQAWVDDVAWTTVELKIDTTRSPGAKDSAVMMELKGNIYAKK